MDIDRSCSAPFLREEKPSGHIMQLEKEIGLFGAESEAETSIRHPSDTDGAVAGMSPPISSTPVDQLPSKLTAALLSTRPVSVSSTYATSRPSCMRSSISGHVTFTDETAYSSALNESGREFSIPVKSLGTLYRNVMKIHQTRRNFRGQEIILVVLRRSQAVELIKICFTSSENEMHVTTYPMR